MEPQEVSEWVESQEVGGWSHSMYVGGNNKREWFGQQEVIGLVHKKLVDEVAGSGRVRSQEKGGRGHNKWMVGHK